MNKRNSSSYEVEFRHGEDESILW